MHLILRRLRAAAADEGGFTFVVVMGVMFIVLLLSAAAIARSDGDLLPGLKDRERKQAYAAAEAGVNDYLARLVASPDYWKNCADVTDNPSLGGVWTGTGTRPWAPVGGTSTARYTVELLPANGAANCAKADPVGTFIDTNTGTFRIRATGEAKPGGAKRSIIATFKRKGFLDYIYYTDLESNDPILLARSTRNLRTRDETPAQRSVQQWAATQCGKYWRQGRGDVNNDGYYFGRQNPPEPAGAPPAPPAGLKTGTGPDSDPAQWTDFGTACGEIRFRASTTDTLRQDRVLGPLHTEDEIFVCGAPVFGRRPSDDIEVTGTGSDGTGAGWRPDTSGDCGASQPFVNMPGETSKQAGTWRNRAPSVKLPPSNAALKTEALPAYRFLGRTTIVLNGASMTVTGKRENGTTLTNQTMAVPRDGLIYVSNDAGCPEPGYDPLNPYPATQPCGNVWLSGSYSRSLTIASENDVVFNGNVTRSGDVLLGVIPDDWARVHHPTTGCTASGGGTNAAGTMQDVTIQAAILTVKHSFTVDSFWCGASLGTLTVDGAIGQKHRGPVGTSGGGNYTGYTKNYTYDDRLRYRSPPKFLDPVQSAWRLKSQVEQVPANATPEAT